MFLFLICTTVYHNITISVVQIELPTKSIKKNIKMVLFNRITTNVIKSAVIKNSSTVAQVVHIQEESPQSFRTRESNPAKHNNQHLTKFYTILPNDVKTMYTHGLPMEYRKQIKTFNEMCLLIRKPALELLSCLRQTDFTKPVNKYVIYGENGCGKTSTLLHILHYGYVTNKIIVNVHWAQMWYRYPKEVTNSSTKEDMLDLPIDAAAWLINFKNLNMQTLKEADIRLSKSYEWSSNVISKDSPIVELIDFGVSRVKYACDIVEVVLNELKEASIAGKCKILVAIDGYNAFYANHTQIKNDEKKFVPASKVSLTQAFLDITKSDWCNGEIVITVDQYATKDRRDSHLPRYLLTKEGFDHLDPFYPISVENYTEDEFDTVVEYYKNRKWIRNITPDGQKELKLLTGGNPYKLMDYCKHL